MKLSSLSFYLANPWRIVQQLRYRTYLRKNPGVPWMAPNVVEFLNTVITKNDKILEWGSGGSTAWFAARAQSVVSVENNKFWYEKVKRTLQEKRIQNVDYRLIDVDESINQDECIKKGIIPPYVAVVNTYPEEHFDMVIVDGSHRNICINQVPKRLKRGGYMVLDNSNWMSFEKWGVSKEWKLVSHHDVGVSCTTVWQKN